jgi:cation diffusion facilitator family transporter
LANAWEKRSDAFSSIAVFLGIAGAKLGFHFLDPLAAILVAIYILKFSLEMIGEAFRGLLDSALDSKLIEGVRSCIGEMEGVLGVARIRSREIGQNVWIDLEIFVDGEAPVTDVARIKDQVRRSVAKKVERPSKVVVYLKPAPG